MVYRLLYKKSFFFQVKNQVLHNMSAPLYLFTTFFTFITFFRNVFVLNVWYSSLCLCKEAETVGQYRWLYQKVSKSYEVKRHMVVPQIFLPHNHTKGPYHLLSHTPFRLAFLVFSLQGNSCGKGRKWSPPLYTKTKQNKKSQKTKWIQIHVISLSLMIEIKITIFNNIWAESCT